MEAQGHQTREAWLNYIAERIAPVFENLGAPLLEPRNSFQMQYSRSAYAADRIGTPESLCLHVSTSWHHPIDRAEFVVGTSKSCDYPQISFVIHHNILK